MPTALRDPRAPLPCTGTFGWGRYGHYLSFIALVFLLIFLPALHADSSVVFYRTAAPNNSSLYSDSSVLLSSFSGDFLLAAGTAVYTSQDAGETWVRSVHAPTGPFSGGAMNKTGQLNLLVSSTVSIMISNDYGITWNKANVSAPLNTDWTSVSCSSSGKYIAASVRLGGIWLSINYGITWALTTAPSNQVYWTSVAVSANGKYMIGGVSYTQEDDEYYFTVDGFLWMSSNSGSSWSMVPNMPFYCYEHVTVSYDGQHMTASQCSTVDIETKNVPTLWTSNNYGSNFTAASPVASWDSVAVSSDGQYQLAVSSENEVVFVSQDYGFSWRLVTYGGDEENNIVSYAVAAVSATGQYMSTGSNNRNFILYSTNYGVTWSLSINDNYVGGMVISDSGSYMFATSEDTIIRSTDNGRKWTTRYSNTSAFLGPIACTSNGEIVIVGGSLNGPYYNYSAYVLLSTNFGVNWTFVTAIGTGNWMGVTTDTTGKYLAAVSSESQENVVWTSASYGNTWIRRSNPPQGYIFSMKSDSTGQTLYAGTTELWVSKNFGKSWSIVDCSADISNCILDSGISEANLAALSVASINASVILTGGSYVAGPLYLYNSSIGWQTGLTAATESMEMASHGPSNLIASTQTGLFTSNCYGAFWTAANFTVVPTALSADSWTAVASDEYGVDLVAMNTFVKGIFSTDAASTATPTTRPSRVPSTIPTKVPTSVPSVHPTQPPSTWPTCFPSVKPSVAPSPRPTTIPTTAWPTESPTTGMPSKHPSAAPTSATQSDSSSASSSGSGAVYGAIVGVIGGGALLIGAGYYLLVVVPKTGSLVPQTFSSPTVRNPVTDNSNDIQLV
jgi:hypothetical protein